MEVYLMLVGFACELAIKSRLVGKLRRGKRNQIIADNELPKGLKSHNLKALCGVAGISVDGRDEEMLDLLSKMVWRGRYPIPRRAAELTPTFLSSSRIVPMATFLSRVTRGKLSLDTTVVPRL